MKALLLTVDLFRLSCAYVPDGAALQALNQAAKAFSPCGIEVRAGRNEVLQARPEWCFLPDKERERQPLIRDIAGPRRRKNPRAMSLFLLPSDPVKPRWSFSIVDKTREAGCASPAESRFLSRFGSLFMSEFAFKSSDPELPGLLLAHEIAHVLTMRSHPTRLPRGHVLADGITDMGYSLNPGDCECMRRSPYLK